MKRNPAIIVGALVVAVATGSAHVTNLPRAQVDALSGIDVTITSSLIEGAFGPAPLAELITLARTPGEDPGVRIRAYRALHLYASPEARAALAADIAALSSPTSGTEVLYLRAAIESLGLIGQDPDVAGLVPLLDFEASRDIRTATANALGAIGSPLAIDPLRERLSHEQSQQVRLAISRALDNIPLP